MTLRAQFFSGCIYIFEFEFWVILFFFGLESTCWGIVETCAQTIITVKEMLACSPSPWMIITVKQMLACSPFLWTIITVKEMLTCPPSPWTKVGSNSFEKNLLKFCWCPYRTYKFVFSFWFVRWKAFCWNCLSA